jgi:predicted nucleotidyltransferase
MRRRLDRIRLEPGGLDTDRRGFYLPSADLEWSLAGVPEQLETENEEVYWEIEKFIRLALKANPNVLECLYSPLVETCTPLASELIDMRDIFLSQYVHRTYDAYSRNSRNSNRIYGIRASFDGST